MHELLYIGITGIQMGERYSKHKYDIEKCPDQNEPVRHKFHKNADIDSMVEVQILMHGKMDEEEWKRLEDKAICKLQTMEKHGLNDLLWPYAKEMYKTWT